MKIDKTKLKKGMWYVDKNNNVIEQDENIYDAPANAAGYYTKWALQLTEVYHARYTNKDTCKHKHKHINRTWGWIEGMKGRECKSCGKTQVRKWWQPWGCKWNDGAEFREVFAGNTAFNCGSDCIVAMVNSGDYTLAESIVVYADSCERCMNVLAYKYLNGADGYAEYSEEWHKANTVCDFCRHEESDQH